MRVCVIKNCNKKHEAKNFCKNHYKSFIKYGDPLAVEIRKQEKEKQKHKKDKKKRIRKNYSTNGTCEINGCNDPIKAKKLCEKHYARQLRKGTTELSTIKRGSIETCLALDCKKPYKSNGYCSTHAKYFRETGSPYIPKVIKLCGVTDCYEKHWGKGMCQEHFYELRKITNKNRLYKQTFEEKTKEEEEMSKWNFEHDEFECEKCRTNNGAYPLNLYLGVYKGKDAQKYICSNKECDFVEIKTFDELMEEQV